MSSISQELSKRSNHAKWIAMLELYKEICSKGGYIFGGAVRDYVKRTLAAQKFEKFCNSNCYKFKDCYDNKNIQPETYTDRNLFPNDIDIYIHDAEYKLLFNDLISYFDIKSSDSTDINYFFENDTLLADAIEFKRVYINLFKSVGSKMMDIILKNVKHDFQIKIDFIIVKPHYRNNNSTRNGGSLFPPFGKFDFTVNHLFMYDDNGDISIDISKDILVNKYESNQNTHQQIYHSIIEPLQVQKTKNDLLTRIFSDIENSIADPIYPTPKNMFRLQLKYGTDYKFIPDSYRIHKMVSKGYKIDIYRFLKNYNNFTIIDKPESNPNNPDKCIICFDELTSDKKAIQYNGCCSAKFDIECFIRYIQNPQMTDNPNSREITCPHCRTPYKNECPCYLMEFVGILLHKFKVFSKEENCPDCINSTCDKWIINCNCGNK